MDPSKVADAHTHTQIGNNNNKKNVRRGKLIVFEHTFNNIQSKLRIDVFAKELSKTNIKTIYLKTIDWMDETTTMLDTLLKKANGIRQSLESGTTLFISGYIYTAIIQQLSMSKHGNIRSIMESFKNEPLPKPDLVIYTHSPKACDEVHQGFMKLHLMDFETEWKIYEVKDDNNTIDTNEYRIAIDILPILYVDATELKNIKF